MLYDASRRTVTQSLTKAAKNPKKVFFEFYVSYDVFCFPVTWDDLSKHLSVTFHSFMSSNSHAFYNRQNFLLDLKCVVMKLS